MFSDRWTFHKKKTFSNNYYPLNNFQPVAIWRCVFQTVYHLSIAYLHFIKTRLSVPLFRKKFILLSDFFPFGVFQEDNSISTLFYFISILRIDKNVHWRYDTIFTNIVSGTFDNNIWKKFVSLSVKKLTGRCNWKRAALDYKVCFVKFLFLLNLGKNKFYGFRSHAHNWANKSKQNF